MHRWCEFGHQRFSFEFQRHGIADDGAQGFAHVGFVAGDVGEGFDQAVPDLTSARQEALWRPSCRGIDLALGGVHVAFGGFQLGLHCRADDAGADGDHDVAAHALGVGEVAFGAVDVGGQRCQFLAHGAGEQLKRAFGQQLLACGGQYGVLDGLAWDPRTEGAGAALAARHTSVGPAVQHDHPAAAARAAQHAGQQVVRGATVAVLRVSATLHARLHGIEGVGVDDAQIRLVGDDPFRSRSLASNALAVFFRVPYPFRPVPHLLSGIDRVDQDAESALAVAADGRCAPRMSARRWHAVAVQFCGNVARRLSGEIFRVNAPHDRGLWRVDGAPAGFRDAIAVGQAAGAGAGERAAGKPAMGFLGEVIKVHLGH